MRRNVMPPENANPLPQGITKSNQRKGRYMDKAKHKKRASLAEAIEQAKETGRYIKKQMPQGWGFVLILAEFNEPDEMGAMTYLSSIERETCIEMLKEFIQKQENNETEIRDTN